jgi:hypothetical protein
MFWGLVLACLGTVQAVGAMDLAVGFSAVDVTPPITAEHPVYLAGYGPGRTATSVHDPLMARCVVLQHGNTRVAIVSVDSVGLQLPTVERIRAALTDYLYVLVTSTHDHEAPDVIGLWGANPLQSGVDPKYLDQIVQGCVQAVRQAETRLQTVTASYGTACDETLLNDSRRPYVKDGVLRAILFEDSQRKKPAGILVQWNCHPEALGSRNRQITADFPWATVEALQKQYGCPVVYMSGALGGLMAPPRGIIRDEAGNLLSEGTFAYAEQYGKAVAQLAQKALAAATPIRLAPLRVSHVQVSVPVTNPWYRAARAAGILKRDSRVWTGDPYQIGDALSWRNATRPMAVTTEVGVLACGELRIACIPGELYPELVYGQFEDPPQPEADYPDAPLEPTVATILGSGPWMIAGLANDEIGYIIPKRQWDWQAPFCYGRSTAQYGEVNSCGPDVASVIMNALARCATQLQNVPQQSPELSP